MIRYKAKSRNELTRVTMLLVDLNIGFTVVYSDLIIKIDTKVENAHKPNKELIKGLYNFSPVVPEVLGTELEAGEPFFSKAPCQTCGSELAGDRYICTATLGKKHTNPCEKLDICVDCYEYFFT